MSDTAAPPALARRYGAAPRTRGAVIGRSRRLRLLLAALAALVALAGGVAWLLRDPMPHFVARRSALARTAAQPAIADGEYLLQVVRVTGTSGLEVDLTVRRSAADGDARLPLVVILGGHRTGKDAVRLLGHTRGAVVAAMSYPYAGSHRPDPLTFVGDIPKIRRAFLDTPPAVQLSLDYLLSLPGIDTMRVEAVGVSLGAPFVTIAGALDGRIDRVWAIHGSGGSYAPLEKNMRRKVRPAPLRWLAAAVANVIVSGPRLAPERWAGRIAPRPYVMINAEGDERIPREQVLRLHAAAGDPKELIWRPGGHVRADSATIAPLVGIVWDRVVGPAH